MILTSIVMAIAFAAVYAEETMTVTRTTFIGSDCPHSYAEHTMETCKVFTIPARITDMSRFDQGVAAELKTKVSDPSVRSSISAAMATRISQASSKVSNVAQEQGVTATMGGSQPIQQRSSLSSQQEQVVNSNNNNNWSAGNAVANDVTTFKGAVFSASSVMDSTNTQVPFYWNDQSSSGSGAASAAAAPLPNDGKMVKADAVTSNTNLNGAQVAVASNQQEQQQQQQQQQDTSSGWKKVVGTEMVNSNSNNAAGSESASNQAAGGSSSSSGGQTVGYRVYQYGSDIPVA